ncbi:MAG: DUF2848 family protein [Deltaproteobacteria bacterium]|nr:DUF2848 family protein [Deltaproteobacteria bacterium]
MTTLELHLQKKNKSAPVQFRVKKMINAGYVGRDTSAVKAHIDELQREGVSPPPSVPMIFPVLSQNITTSDRIEVLGNKTSGEAEYVLLLEGDRLYVGVGSDHTDRDLETYSIVHSKQVCHNVMSANIWDYSDIQDYWDELVIQSWVKTGVFEEEILYQKASLGTIISAEDLIALVRSRLRDGSSEGLVIFSGTVPILTSEMVYGDYFRSELIDSRTGASLTCEYSVQPMDYLKGEIF